MKSVATSTCYMLDLLVDCTQRYETRGQDEYTLFAQPGMRFAIAKALIHSLMQDEYFASRPESDKTHIAEKILEDVKGRMMEDIILLETSKALPSLIPIQMRREFPPIT